MKRTWFVIVFSLFWCIYEALPFRVFAAPAISSVSGTVSNGNTITVSGSGFGSTGPNVILYDDFELGTNGGNLSDQVRNAQIGTWRDVSVSISPYYPTYSNLQSHSGSLAVRQNWGSGAGTQEGARWIAPTMGGTYNNLYFSFWTYLPAGQNVPGSCSSGPGCGTGSNWKVWWLSTNDLFQNDYASEIVTDPPYETSICWVDGTQNRACYGYAGFSFTKGRWKRWEVHMVGSTTNGSAKLWFTDSGNTRTLWGSSTGRTLDDGTTGWGYLHFPGFGRYDSNSNTFYDDIYVASGSGALARVEIGNASTLGACTNLATATPTSWNDTSIQATVRQGSFINGSAYLYVIDSTGVVNATGYPITIGGGTPAPASCNTVTTSNFSDAIYNSYGAPFDAFQTSTNLMNAKCTSSDMHTINLTTGITGDTTRIVYTKGYYYDPVTAGWTQYSGTCNGALNGEWCQGSISATITNPNISTASAANPTYLVGMTCSVQGGSWKCGCRDTTCSNFYWQVQGAGM